MKKEWIIDTTIRCSACPHVWRLRSTQELTEEIVEYWVYLVIEQHGRLAQEGEYDHEM